MEKKFFPKKFPKMISENDFGAQGLIFRGGHNGIKSSVGIFMTIFKFNTTWTLNYSVSFAFLTYGI